jgi:predicted nucleic acid-binding protein
LESRRAAAQATLIVSGDKDLLDLHPYQGIPILPAAAALQRLEPNKAS